GEDGIRDRNVTGVQTCALPIFLAISASLSCLLFTSLSPFFSVTKSSFFPSVVTVIVPSSIVPYKGISFCLNNSTTSKLKWPYLRSEERRVGKECRPRGSHDDTK